MSYFDPFNVYTYNNFYTRKGLVKRQELVSPHDNLSFSQLKQAKNYFTDSHTLIDPSSLPPYPIPDVPPSYHESRVISIDNFQISHGEVVSPSLFLLKDLSLSDVFLDFKEYIFNYSEYLSQHSFLLSISMDYITLLNGVASDNDYYSHHSDHLYLNSGFNHYNWDPNFIEVDSSNLSVFDMCSYSVLYPYISNTYLYHDHIFQSFGVGTLNTPDSELINHMSYYVTSDYSFLMDWLNDPDNLPHNLDQDHREFFFHITQTTVAQYVRCNFNVQFTINLKYI